MTGTGDQRSFGALLRQARRDAGLTQEELSSRSGLSVRSISALESARTGRPRFRSVALLTDALGAAEPLRARLLAAVRADQSASAGDFGHPNMQADLPVPQQLPQTVPDFVGRERAVAQLTAALVPGDVSAGVRAALVCGQPGAGKTTLALWVAHLLRSAFPDGQLWAHLGGASARPRDPGEVLGEWLRALGAHGAVIPDGKDERAALLRSRLADRRVLLVADDAGSSAQVLPLLPGTSGSAVLVTSRRQLAGLPCATLVVLDPLTPGEAVGLLSRIAGHERMTAEPQAASDLAEACGFLPLALRIAGARLAARPAWPVSLLAGKMTGERRRLDELEAEELSVRVSVQLSYAALGDRARRAFRLLGLLGPVDVADWVIAALLGEPDADPVVNELVERSLLTPLHADATGQPRYRLHDLLHDYARERLADEPANEQQAALRRALSGWLQLANLASHSLPPHPFFPPAAPDHIPPAIRDELARRLTHEPLDWFAAERLNLLEAVRCAGTSGWHSLAIQLAICQSEFQHMQHRADEITQLWKEIVEISGQTGDSTALAHAELRYAAALIDRGLAADAVAPLVRSARKFEQADDQGSLALTLYWQAACEYNLGNFDAALRYAERGLTLARRIADKHAEFLNLRQVGQSLCILGRTAEGVEACERAVSVAGELGQESYDTVAQLTLAFACVLTGDYDRTVTLGMDLLKLSRQTAYTRLEGVALGLLGDAYHGLGRYREAVQALSEALPIFRDHADTRYHGLCLLKLGYAYQRMDQYQRAADCLKDSLPIFQGLRLPHYEQRAHETLTACLSTASNGRQI
jgi:tetratricopeptide (TPR) repeat protein/transcriptional regulator with XRE-family HTH domain